MKKKSKNFTSDISHEEDPAELWYRDGLKFECCGCGSCCTGSPGYVWVNEEEIDALAQHFQLSSAEFEEIYVRKVGRRKSLREFQNYDCVFFDRFFKNCKIYLLRPRQCRTWPFWNSNLETEDDWDTISRRCPGCNRGETIPLEEILKRKSLIEI
ncbi:MAG: YkgJ family cysteine cluster protein [Planctomycetia bacterium]|nr:YkgJ family cysteine cluster protein [Planctomycetia bacterium]